MNTYSRVAKCGHAYESHGPRGRVRLTGDCECHAMPPQSMDLTCLRCGSEFTHKTFREHCTKPCAEAIRRRRSIGLPVSDRPQSCERCGVDIFAMRQGTRRCADCSGATTPVFAEKVCANPRCGSTFTPWKTGQVSCGNSCAQKVWKAANRKPEDWAWDERRKARSQERRALKLQLPSENIVAREVFERDGWACGLCPEPVDASLVWPDPMSPTLDHITPLSRGGSHTLGNVQLAHARCNLSKGARINAAS